jgi:hypothetical protein
LETNRGPADEGDAMKEDSQMQSNGSSLEGGKEVPVSRRRNIVTGVILALGVLLVLALGYYLAVIAISKDGF